LKLKNARFEIERVLAHRPPFLFVDQIESCVPGIRATGISGRIREKLEVLGWQVPYVPSWYLLELMAQVGAVATLSTLNGCKKTLMTGIDHFHYVKLVDTEQVMRAEVEILSFWHGMGKRRGRVFSGDDLIAEATIRFAVISGE
jgi:3-hydroxyacyl-[acyl-carrier-protein] dehydratase